ncbi:transcription termination factor NusA [Desulfatirhabdium butyrativorans]|uniref:transcription termination factor NusA n=1 Tax=Desulfatirhabdium butyrativorans TaxID=340467 RepID=UPI0003FD3D5D|nr:transcription termination factor NusA [Desulfatirhabdium butyrativorans]
MYITEIKRIVDQVSRDKGIDRDILIQAIEEAIKSAARKRFGHRIELEISYNQQNGELEVYQYLEVVEEVENPETQISLKDGRKLDPECEIGDSLGIKLDTEQFGRIAAQSAKQIIIQKMKEAERSAVYANYIDHKGDIINGIVQRIEHGDLIVNLGQAEAILKTDQQIPKETYRRGDRIRAYIMDVLDPEKKEGVETAKRTFRGPQIILSRTHPNFLIHLFKTEVPEISEGVVQIKGAARDPGIRAKIAVTSTDSDIDPVGACVGVKGSRVQNVVQELRGEKIDIVLWHIDPARFVCNALAPAQITRVIIDEINRSMEVIVPDEFLSIAIGKKGQNVKLAHKLTGWKLDVKSEKQYAEIMEKNLAQLASIEDVGAELAAILHQKGLFSLEDLFHATEEDLMVMTGIDSDRAARIIAQVQELQSSRTRKKSGKEAAPGPAGSEQVIS